MALTKAQIEERTEAILDTQKQRQATAGDEQYFASVGREGIEKALTEGNVAMLGDFGSSLSAPPGGIIDVRIGVDFSDPTTVPPDSNIYVHVWISSGNIDPQLSAFLTNVDSRFPRLTQPKAPGLQPGTSQVPDIPVRPDRSLLDFKLQVPIQVELTNYLGNICLMQRNAFGVGTYLGRGSFEFRVRGIDEPPDLWSWQRDEQSRG